MPEPMSGAEPADADISADQEEMLDREIWEGMDADEAEWPQPEHRTRYSGGNRLWSDEYKEARQYLYGSDEVRQDFAEAFRLFLLEAESGNPLAMHDLGRMLADGLGGKSMQPKHRNGTPKRWRHSRVWSRTMTMRSTCMHLPQHRGIPTPATSWEKCAGMGLA